LSAVESYLWPRVNHVTQPCQGIAGWSDHTNHYLLYLPCSPTTVMPTAFTMNWGDQGTEVGQGGGMQGILLERGRGWTS
jgi:hypothetical protein